MLYLNHEQLLLRRNNKTDQKSGVGDPSMEHEHSWKL
jgi:hypothetical protein